MTGKKKKYTCIGISLYTGLDKNGKESWEKLGEADMKTVALLARLSHTFTAELSDGSERELHTYAVGKLIEVMPLGY